jgi:hypothetical protein
MEAWNNFSKSFQYLFSTFFFSWFFVKNVVLMRTQEDNKVAHIKFGKFLSCLMTHIAILFGKLNINNHESQKVGRPNQNFKYCQYVCALPF